MKPIIFVFGPSGVGKSLLSEKLAKLKFLHVHIDTDRKGRSFAANGFPTEWDDDFHKVNPAHVVSVLRDRLDNEHAGAVVSFPTVHVFVPEKLVEAAQLGVTPVVLWGKQEDCIQAAEKRIKKKGRPFNLPHYQRQNKPTFQAYGRPEYDAFRVEAFREDRSRYTVEELLGQIIKRTAG